MASPTHPRVSVLRQLSAPDVRGDPEPRMPARPKSITFRHPGYPDGHDVMFRLQALDCAIVSSQPQSDEPVWGLHHLTAIQACSIVACNTPGVLLSYRLGANVPASASDVPPDAVLTAPAYWFYPFGWRVGDLPYPLCPDFENWQFPHTDIPTEWLAMEEPYEFEGSPPAPSQYSRAVNERDRSCRISRFVEMTQVAHLVPKDERPWFDRNEMHLYNLSSTLPTLYETSDIRNCLRLRQDLHTLFDTGAFTFVPKEGKSVVHFLIKGPNYCETFHNRAPEPLSVDPAFLYARFAWAILPHATSFISKKNTRIMVFNEETEKWEVTTAGEAKKSIAATSKRRKRQGGAAAGQEVVDAECMAKGPVDKQKASTDVLDQQPARSKADTFHKIVSSNPAYAWHAIYWHPETERFDKLREKALQEREPELHRMEKERQRDLLGRDRAPIPYEEECLSFDDDTEEELDL